MRAREASRRPPPAVARDAGAVDACLRLFREKRYSFS
jgi:hypothetical protein